jgi:hypothetical protein
MTCETRIKSEYIAEIKNSAKNQAKKRNIEVSTVISSGNLVITFFGRESESYGAAMAIKYSLKKAYNVEIGLPTNNQDRSKSLYIGIKKDNIQQVVNIVNTNKVNTFSIPEKTKQVEQPTIETKPNRIQKEIKNKPGVQLDLFDTEIKKEMFQSDKEYFNALLKQKLFNFVKGLGIEINENADDILNKLNLKSGNPLSAFDTLQKYLALSSNITKKDLLLQNANIIYTFLGKKSVLGIELWKNISQWSKYNEFYNYYNKQNIQENENISEEIEYSNENFNVFAHKQAIIHFIAGALDYGIKNNYTGEKRDNPDLDKSYFENLGYKNKYEQNWLKAFFNKIWNFINENILNNKAIKIYNEQELKNLVLDIVDDVFKNDYKKFIRSYYTNKEGKIVDTQGNEFEQKFYEETLNKDPFAKSIIQKLFSNPFMNYKLSGSQVLRKYGVVLRALNEDLHDIDGVIPLETFRKENNSLEFYNWIQEEGLDLMKKRNHKQFLKKIIPFLEDQSWYKNIKTVFPSWKIQTAFIGKDHKKGESITITGYIEHPTEKEIDPDTNLEIPKRYILDFFLRTDEGNYPEIFDNYWKDWKQIFEAKINMGRAKDLNDLIYFKPFIEDKYKFTNKGFRYFTFAEMSKTQTTDNFNQEDTQIINNLINKGEIKTKCN